MQFTNKEVQGYYEHLQVMRYREEQLFTAHLAAEYAWEEAQQKKRVALINLAEAVERTRSL